MRAREQYGFEYLGEHDNYRVSSQPLSDEEIMEQLRKIIVDVEEKPTTPGELSTTTRLA